MVKQTSFGKLADGKEALLFHLENGDFSATVTNYGATLVSFCGKNKAGETTDVLLGFDNVTPYEGAVGSMGAVVGRFANRIEKGKFQLGDKEYTLAVNNGPNHLHGGLVGFNRKLFGFKTIDNCSVQFSYLCPDGEEGYPGNLDVQVTYSLSQKGELTLDYYAICDSDTIINLTNHSYFNLNGVDHESDINNHFLTLNSSAYCDTDEFCLANGDILSVRNTPMDFRNGANVGERLNQKFKALELGKGLDHNFVLPSGGIFQKYGELYSEQSGILMELFTDQPGVQVYSGNFLTKLNGKNGVTYDYRGGICLETQGYPNATSFSHFPSPVLKKGQIYRRKTSYKLSVK